MTWPYLTHVVVLTIAAIAALLIALYTWLQRDTPGSVYFSLLMAAVAVWAFAAAAEFTAMTMPAKIAWSKLAYVGVVSVSPLWLLFALSYSQHTGWLTRRSVAALWIVPLLILGLAVTNERHHLIWSTITPVSEAPGAMLISGHGPGFWVHAAYAYSLLLAGTFWLVRTALHSPQLYRQQVGALILGAIIPWSGDVLYLLNAGPWPGLDLTPIAFVLTGLVIAWGLYRFQMFDLTPVARDALIESMADGMLVLDNRNRVVDVNPAASRMIGRDEAGLVGQPAANVLADWPDLLERYRDAPEAQAEIAVNETQWLDLRISPLYDRRRKLTGRLIALRDITERKQMEEALRRQTVQQQQLLEAARHLTASLDPTEVLTRVAAAAKAILEAYSCDIYLLAAGGKTLTPVVTLDPFFEQEILSAPLNVDNSFTGLAVKARRGLIINDAVSATSGFQIPGTPVDQDERVIVVPLMIQDKVLGATCVNRMGTLFSEQDLTLAEAFAVYAAIALKNAQAHRELEREMEERRRAEEALARHAEQLATLNRIGLTITSGLDMDRVLRALHEQCKQVATIDTFYVALYDQETGLIHFPMVYDRGEYLAFDSRDIRTQPGASSYVIQNRQTLYLPDTLDPSVAPSVPVPLTRTGGRPTRSYLGVPLILRDQVMGVLSMQSYQPNAYDSDHIRLLETLATQAAIAIENARLYAEVRRRAEELEQQALELQAQRDFAQQVMNAMGQGLTVTDAEGRFEFVNPAYARLFGHSPTELIGKRPGDVALPEDYAILAECRAQQEDGETTTHERRLARADGSEAHVLITGVPRWREGKVAGAIAVITDLTERKRAEEEIRHLREDMTNMLVHDLRNPLGVASTALELLESDLADNLSAEQHQTLNIVKGQASKMRGLVNRILEIGQLEQQQFWLNRAPIVTAHLVGEALKLQTPLASAKGLRLESDIPPDLPPAWADAELIGRVLQNLLDNACKFTPPGGVVCITATTGESQGRPALLVSVSDTGPGIPDEIRNRLFQKFVRGKHMGRGSGLGLAFCKLAVEAHGGRIEAESTPGRGTTFTFSLNTTPNA